MSPGNQPYLFVLGLDVIGFMKDLKRLNELQLHALQLYEVFLPAGVVQHIADSIEVLDNSLRTVIVQSGDSFPGAFRISEMLSYERIGQEAILQIIEIAGIIRVFVHLDFR